MAELPLRWFANPLAAMELSITPMISIGGGVHLADTFERSLVVDGTHPETESIKIARAQGPRRFMSSSMAALLVEGAGHPKAGIPWPKTGRFPDAYDCSA